VQERIRDRNGIELSRECRALGRKRETFFFRN
jgi:hypothetical protein